MPDARPANRPEFVLAIHGGAGVIDRSQMSEELERAYRAALDNVLAVGRDVLAGGGRSIDAVVAAVTTLEDDPLFNAGRGAAFTAEGVNELDAAVMDGGSLKAGAVTLVTTVRNPVKLARLVMDETRHVLLAGHGAEALARLHGLDIVDPRYFHTERRWNALQRMRSAAQAPHAPAVSEAEKHGTVGAVALDRYGNLAAATSTGGRNNKLPGRVGDSPLIGAGTYASNATAAVSCTGEGEYFITTAAAYAVSALMEMKGATVEEAAKSVIHERLSRAGGRGGLIALDAQGNIAMPFSTAGMYRGCARSGSASTVHIYK